MIWLKSSWRWAVLNTSAATIMVIVVTWGSTTLDAKSTYDSVIESGKWAMRCLLSCLAMTPLNTYLNWKSGIGLRKSAGLWAFFFAAVHVVLSVSSTQLSWLQYPIPLFIALGLTALAILAALAATSNRWAMKRLGKAWKRLHRLVYAAGGLIAAHALLALGSTKRMLMDQAISVELTAYAVILAMLLIARIPAVRDAIQGGFVRRVPRGEAL